MDEDLKETIFWVVATIVAISVIISLGYFLGWSYSQENFCEENLKGIYAGGECFRDDSRIEM